MELRLFYFHVTIYDGAFLRKYQLLAIYYIHKEAPSEMFE